MDPHNHDEELCSNNLEVKVVNYCCKTLHLRYLPTSWLHLFIYLFIYLLYLTLVYKIVKNNSTNNSNNNNSACSMQLVKSLMRHDETVDNSF